MATKVKSIASESIEFEDGTILSSEHESDCCENHYLSFADLSLKDFEGLEFDLNGEEFFESVPDYGIRLKPTNGHPVSVPGYGSNNGYYSTNLTLTLSTGRSWDITDCQVISD